jgi:hypothetical protein
MPLQKSPIEIPPRAPSDNFAARDGSDTSCAWVGTIFVLAQQV